MQITRRTTLATLAATTLACPAIAAPTTLVIGAAVFPDSLQPGTSTFAAESLLKQTNEPLFARDNAGDLVPALATEAHQIDETTARLTIRQGVKCHDGGEFTAEDAAFTINYILDIKNGYGVLARISLIETATAIDPHTLELKTKAPFPTMLKGLSFILMQNKRYFDKVGWKGIVAKPMGTGPFVFSKWSAGDRYELTAFKDYWAGPAKVDRLTIREIPDPGTRIASLVSGETHIIEEVPVDLISQVEASSIAKMDEIVSTAGLVLTYDVRIPPFNDPRVRLAFDYAVDKPAIRQAMLKGRGELLDGQLLTATTFGHNPAIKARPFDPDKARALLKEANYRADTPIPMMTQSGKYVSDVDICNAVAGMLNQVGVQRHGRRRGRRRLPPAPIRLQGRTHPHGRLVQPGRRRLRQRLVHERRQARYLGQRGIRTPLPRRPLHQRPRSPASAPTSAWPRSFTRRTPPCSSSASQASTPSTAASPVSAPPPTNASASPPPRSPDICSS